MDKDRKPDAVMMRRVKGTTYVVSSFFNQDSKETAADKMARLIEREAGLGTSVNKNLTLKCAKVLPKTAKVRYNKGINPSPLVRRIGGYDVTDERKGQ